MLSRLFGKVFTTWTEDTPLWRIAQDACNNGYAVVPVKPGGKVPLCTLNANELKKAGPKHPCASNHAITDPKEAKRVFTRLAKAGARLNIGVVAHPSHLVVVDADVPEAVEAFLERWAQAETDEGYLTHSPTVQTPGSKVGDEWKHHDGGHWYFALPENLEPPLPIYPAQLTLPGGADVRWGMIMTVAPPSERAEGRYVSLGDMPEIPAWLLHEIRSHTDRKIDRGIRDADRWANDAIARWAMAILWIELLEPDGWTFTNKLDRRCGCPIFEKPGGGSSSDRSAIAHDNDCDLYENIEGHGALHLFTTDPPEELAVWCQEHHTQTLTKLQYVAAVHHGGDETAAKIALGIEPDFDAWDPRVPESQTPMYGDTGTRRDQDFRAEEPGSTNPGWDPPRELTIEELEVAEGSPLLGLPDEIRRAVKQESGKQRIKPLAAQWNQFVDSGGVARSSRFRASDIPRRRMEATICARIDGTFTLYPRRVSSIYGPSDSGKSWFGLHAAIDTATRHQLSMYLDFEDDEDGFAYRLDELAVPTVVQDRIIYRRQWYPPPPASSTRSSAKPGAWAWWSSTASTPCWRCWASTPTPTVPSATPATCSSGWPTSVRPCCSSITPRRRTSRARSPSRRSDPRRRRHSSMASCCAPTACRCGSPASAAKR